MKKTISKFKKGDSVLITAGKDKGRTGVIEKVFSKQGKVLVPGINQYKKHVKPQGEGRPGEIATLSRPLPLANIALVCPSCKKQTRVGYLFENKKKFRICRKCGEKIIYGTSKTK